MNEDTIFYHGSLSNLDDGEIFGWGLKEAKDFVDILFENDMHFTPKK